MARTVTLISIALIALAAPAAALAAGDDVPDAGEEATEPEPDPTAEEKEPEAEEKEPKRDKARIRVSLKGLDGGRLTFGERARAVVRLKPRRRGERLKLKLVRRGRGVGSKTVTVGPKGKASWKVGPTRPGSYKVRARHQGSRRIKANRSNSKKFRIAYSTLAQGNHGRDVRILNRKLNKMAFVSSKGSAFSEATGRAVLAYRKASRMDRTEVATPQVIKRVLSGKGKVKLRSPKMGPNGRHVEGDIGRQLLILAKGGKPVEIYHTSTGASATPTIIGKFNFYLSQPGFNSKAMYYSRYFIRGYATHGFASVPTYPASHGCLRLPIADAIHIYNWIEIGMPIHTYH